MEIYKIVLSTFASLGSLFLFTKLMGNREMSQLSMFDYIVGISIGSIAAEMATELEEFEKPLIAMIVYTLSALLISLANYKSIKLRRILTGTSLILYENGKLYEANLKKARIDVNEFLTQCRSKGYFNIANLQTVILEPNGNISVLPLATERPATPKDLNITPPEDKPVVDIVIDGQIMINNLKFTGNNENWLYKQLHAQGVDNISEIFLATCDNENNLSVYKKIKKKMSRDIFE